MTPTFSCDSQWFRTSNGVVAGSPLTQFRVTASGSTILDALEQGIPLPIGHEPLTARLLAKGAIHPTVGAPISPTQITVVIPTFITQQHQLTRLHTLVKQFTDIAVIVVDDASPQAYDQGALLSLDNVTVIRHDTNAGPGSARNSGLLHVNTPYVAFIDDDVCVAAHDVVSLAGFLTDDVDIVAPRVMSAPLDGSLADYERYHSPLDLGDVPAVVHPTSRVSYIPSAVLVARVEALRAVNGFDETMRVGEDVDLIWRAIKNKFIIRYVPTVTAIHLPRRTLKDFLRQRFQYGSSAARLDSRHRQHAAPLRTHVVLLLAPVLALCGYFFYFPIALLVTYLWFVFSLRSTQLKVQQRLRVITIGQWATTRLFTTAVARAWWPLVAVLAVFVPRISLLLSLCVIAPPLIELVFKRPRYPSTYVALYILDNFSYGCGLWVGALREKSLRALLPVLTVSSRRLRSQG
jgi:mycofactocin system glycosyltransferase